MKVTTFSRHFPATHPRKGEPTQFVEKILVSLIEVGQISMSKAVEIGRKFKIKGFQSMHELRSLAMLPKHHTIRSGHRWKVGDKFSPRFWTSRPYASKQAEFAPGIEIKKIWTFEAKPDGYFLNGILFDTLPQITTLAQNDGLSADDFECWIYPKRQKPFSGQIICWNPEINY